ncbi:hypothetical protein [Flavilitoribacter nigricans]|nr:hypothetical protein [Flavilitoribacter nigricans]
MNKNPIGLHILFAFLGLGISLLLLGVGAQFIIEIQRYDTYNDDGDLLAGTAFCIGGIVCLIFSIALILRLDWARIAFQVLLILGGIVWLTFMVFLAADSPRAWAVITGMAAAGVMVVIFGVLFLESAYFQQDLRKGHPPGKDHWDILDQ